MNLKFVWQSFTDLHMYVLGLGLIVAAGMTGVSFLIWLSILVLFGIVMSYLEPLRARIGPARAYYQAARHGRKGRFGEAIETATSYLRGHPRDGRAYEMRALGHLGLARHEDALADADRAVIWKRRWQSLMVRGQILCALGCPLEALSDLEASYRLREHPFTRLLMGNAYTSVRQVDTAVAIFRRSTGSVSHSVSHLALAECLRLLGRTAEAEAAYRKAEAKARREVKAGGPSGSILAYSLAQLSRDSEAVEAAGAALERHGRETVALCAQALVNVRRGETDWAEARLRRMLLISPPAAIGALADPQFTSLLSEERFRELLAWALGAQRQTRECVLARRRV